MNNSAIVWFRDDLRLGDHPALIAAAGHGDVSSASIIPVFVFDKTFSQVGGAGKWWLHNAIDALANNIQDEGGNLLLRRGNPADHLLELARASGAKSVYALAARTPAERAEQEKIRHHLAQHNIDLCLHAGALMHTPNRLRTKAGGPFKVFTPFWKAFRLQVTEYGLPVDEAVEKPTCTWSQTPYDTDHLGDWGLLPQNPNWALRFADYWQVSEGAAHLRLMDFLQTDLQKYHELRDFPAASATARLSPYLRWGQISPWRIWTAVRLQMAQRQECSAGGEAFLRQLAWREFAHHVLWANPRLATENLNAKFDRFRWENDPELFRIWKYGRTGFSFVDAAMRELMATGWMHNRGRMVVASFLVKDLLQDWRSGLAWFDDALVDADPALDPFGWQWVAGSGADAAPYFRVFNPVTQAQKFDEGAVYMSQWLPELGSMSSQGRVCDVYFTVLADAVIDHAEARLRALSRYAEI